MCVIVRGTSLWVICLWHLNITFKKQVHQHKSQSMYSTVICLFISHLVFSIKSYLRISNSSFCRTLKPHHTNSCGPSVAFFFVGNIVLIHLVQGFKYSLLLFMYGLYNKRKPLTLNQILKWWEIKVSSPCSESHLMITVLTAAGRDYLLVFKFDGWHRLVLCAQKHLSSSSSTWPSVLNWQFLANTHFL